MEKDKLILVLVLQVILKLKGLEEFGLEMEHDWSIILRARVV